MVIKIQNPFLTELVGLVLVLDNKTIGLTKIEEQRVEERISLLRNKSRQYTQQILKNVAGKIEVVQTKARAVESDFKYISRQYKEMCILYRDADELVKYIREQKKEIREEMQTKSEKKGYDINMVNKKGDILSVDYFEEGGSRSYDGSGFDEANISVTYNYAWFFYKFMDKEKGIKIIYGKTGEQVRPRLQKALDEVCNPDTRGSGNSEVEHNNYWEPTPNNVAKIFKLLISWCKQHPKGIFQGD